MTRPRIVGIAGSVRRPSKSRFLVETVGAKVTKQTGGSLVVYDLADAGPELGSSLSRAQVPPNVSRILKDIETADALVIGTPVYKGSYTGLFKHLFDFIEPDALRTVPVVLTATGGGPRHALVLEHHLRPLFGFFEALTLPTAVYASEADFSDGRLVDASVIERASAAAHQLAVQLNLQSSHSSTRTTLRLASAG